LDNTFCNAGISFPSRHAAAQQVLYNAIILVHCTLYGICVMGTGICCVNITREASFDPQEYP
jgi:hypothetical protein